MPRCKDCIHFKICNDYVYLVGREDKVACPDYKSTEDVVPRAEVEKIFDKYGNYDFPTEPKENFNNTVVTGGYVIDWYKEAGLNAKRIMELEVQLKQAKQEVEELSIELEAMRGAAKSYKMHYENAEQEVARDIFEEIDTQLAFFQKHCFSNTTKIILDVIAELKKKYIGE